MQQPVVGAHEPMHPKRPAPPATETGKSPARRLPLGVIYMCVGVLCLSANDALAKWLGQFYPVGQIVFLRMLIVLPVLAAIGLVTGGRRALVTRRPLFHIVRGIFATGATVLFFWSLPLLPLAEASAIVFSAPLFIALLAGLLLREPTDRRQWIATLGGFIGVLLVVRPGTSAFTVAALLPLGSALCYALMMMSARWLGAEDNLWVTMFYATLVPLVATAGFIPTFDGWPTWEHVPHFVAISVLGGAALTLITQAFRITAAATVAPFDYTGLLWASLFGWLIWGEIPSAVSALGMIVIVGFGVYLASRRDGDEARPDEAEASVKPSG